MYDVRRHTKDREVKLRLDEATYERLCATARENRTQRAVMARELVEQGLAELIEQEGDPHTRPQYSLKRGA